MLSKNTGKKDILNIESAKKVKLSNSICEYNNFYRNSSINLGGCFRTKNILSRNFSNVSVSDSYSDLTNVGIKIIDEVETIYELKSLFNYIDEITVF